VCLIKVVRCRVPIILSHMNSMAGAHLAAMAIIKPAESIHTEEVVRKVKVSDVASVIYQGCGFITCCCGAMLLC